MDVKVIYIESQSYFDETMNSLEGVDCLGFDTEFIGEKTYVPVLCLLQIVVGDQVYLVDTMRVKNLDGFLQLVENEQIVKLTHAGDNDYKLLHTLFGTVPKNVFDIQIAAGFLGYNYPAGFGKIVEKELRISLAKSYSVAKWDERPLDRNAIKYAVEDVQYLFELYDILSNKLKKAKRLEWVIEECAKWTYPDFYFIDPYKEVQSNDLIHAFRPIEQIFLMRLVQWRREKAASADVPRETILPSKSFASIVKAMRDGENAIQSNRNLNEKIYLRHYVEWENLYNEPATEKEKQVLQQINEKKRESVDTEWKMELLYHFIKYRCNKKNISASLLMPKGDFNRLRADNDTFDESMLTGWRADLLGKELTAWLKHRGPMQLSWVDGKCVISMETEG